MWRCTVILFSIKFFAIISIFQQFISFCFSLRNPESHVQYGGPFLCAISCRPNEKLDIHIYSVYVSNSQSHLFSLLHFKGADGVLPYLCRIFHRLFFAKRWYLLFIVETLSNSFLKASTAVMAVEFWYFNLSLSEVSNVTK